MKSNINEMGIIGCILVDPHSISVAYGQIRPEMFADSLLQLMYVSCIKRYNANKPIDVVNLVHDISSDKWPDFIVMQEAKSCVDVVAKSSEIGSFIHAFTDDYKSRQLGEILRTVIPVSAKINDQISGLMARLEALMENKRLSTKTLAEITSENKELYFVDRENDAVKTGFPKLDDLIGGLEGGEMIVIGARPAVGKSALITQIVANIAQTGKKIGFYNLEMQEKQVYERFVVAKSGIGLTRLRRAKRFLGDEQERFEKANDDLERQDGIVITTGGKTVGEIRNESKYMGYDIIVIDYMQLLKSESHTNNRYAEVGAISRAIKSLAMELNIPIVALSQLNRVSEARETKEPTMAEIRESGDIEQDASIIILLWNLNENDRSKKGCKVEKNRQGLTGKFVLQFNGDLMMFEETDETIKDAMEWSDSGKDNPFF